MTKNPNQCLTILKMLSLSRAGMGRGSTLTNDLTTRTQEHVSCKMISFWFYISFTQDSDFWNYGIRLFIMSLELKFGGGGQKQTTHLYTGALTKFQLKNFFEELVFQVDSLTWSEGNYGQTHGC